MSLIHVRVDVLQIPVDRTGRTIGRSAGAGASSAGGGFICPTRACTHIVFGAVWACKHGMLSVVLHSDKQLQGGGPDDSVHCTASPEVLQVSWKQRQQVEHA